ncbi:hypothetical protein BDZ89DRAFT_484850 [Hymenopellis radicata]|nr:hypothetical protein BDZ89DRAFT_484850 [Hymenopellis radicata]
MHSSIDYRRTTRPDGRGPWRTMGHWSLTSTLEPKGETLMIMAGLERSKVHTPYPSTSFSTYFHDACSDLEYAGS